MNTTTVLLVAALVLDAGAALYFFATGHDPSHAPRIVAACVAAVITVGALVALVHRTQVRERTRMLADSNAAIGAVAARAGLALSPPPLAPPAGGAAAAAQFVEARGARDGIPVRISVEPVATDTLETVVFFPRASVVVDRAALAALDRAALGALAAAAERVSDDDGGLTLALSRRPAFWSLSSYDRVPEASADRLLAALDAGWAVLRPLRHGPAAPAAAPPAGR
jgi:hypothetical protein